MATLSNYHRREALKPSKVVKLVPLDPPRPAKPIDYRFGLYFALHTAGFLSVTLLMTLGLFVLFFLAIGGFSIDGMMHHLANMSARYVEADAARIASFKWIIGSAFMAFAATFIVFRRHAMIPADLRSPRSIEEGHGNG